ncbi:nesprin-2 isoform X3 [Hyperolius riggenbachi]|uniref:nesprin-2 isoform X3 n=1 Tax=Hyperolius riggenbachi TaxID=752182 RepID=UPI0035A28981
MSSDSGSSISAGEDQQHLAIDQRHQLLQAEQEGTQRRTFTNWIHSQLSKHQKESVVKDLYSDIKDGHLLLDLLEVLSGENLPREKGKNVFQSRSNIESALAFLGKRSIEGLASILAATDEVQPVTCDTKKAASPTASPSPKRSAKSRWKISAKKVLLQWAQEQCARDGSVNVTDFKSSWKTGQAFLAIIHSLRPDLVDMEKFRVKSNEEKLREAFRIAEEDLKIPRLLEPEDVNVANPDEKSIMTYVAQFLQYSKNIAEPTRNTSDQVSKAIAWLNSEEQTLKKLFSEMKDETYTKKYQEILLFMRRFNEQKRIYMSDLAVENLQPEEQRLIKQLLENITYQIAQWKEQLDRSLPPPLDAIESWLSEVENLMSQTLPESGSHYNNISLLQTLSVSFKALMVRSAGYLESLRSFKNVDDNGVVLVPADKTEEMKTRMEKILAANFSVLVDYRCSGHCILALLEEGWPKLKAWRGKYLSQEAAEAFLADYNEFIDEKQFMENLEIAFQKFKELHSQLLITEEYSDDPEITKQYEMIALKYEKFVASAQDTRSVLENVVTCWIQFENNVGLLTVWLDEQQKMHPAHVPMEILAKWKSVCKSLNRDCHFLMERTNDKATSKLSHRLKALNSRWARYLKLHEEQKRVGNGGEAHEDLTDGRQEGSSSKQSDITAQALRTHVQTVQWSAETEEALQACLDLLSRLEKMEKLTDSANNWAEGAEQVLTAVLPAEAVSESVIGAIQDFYEDGISHQEQLAEAQRNVQAVSQFILSHEDIQHLSADGLKRNIARAQEKTQELVSRLGFVLHPPEQPLLEEDIKKNFERSKLDLEAYITSAMTLLAQRVNPEEFISQYEETLGKFSSQNLEKFLKAAEQVKSISSSKEKVVVEKVSADLRGRWKIVHDELESYVSGLKLRIGKKTSDDQPLKTEKQISASVSAHQNGGSFLDSNETNGSGLDALLQKYEAQHGDLELILQSCRENLAAESPREAQDVTELQIRLADLELLQEELRESWRQFESSSSAAERLMDTKEKKTFSERRSALQWEVEAVTEDLASRMQSLSVTINVLLPIEQEISVLCESSLQTPVQEMERFPISHIDTVYQELQEIQSSVEDQIQQCDNLESAAEVTDPTSSVDAQAVQSIVQQYKLQLEATSEAMKERETLLKDLQSFLSSLAKAKRSIQEEVTVRGMGRSTILQKQKNLDLLEQELQRLRQEAEELDNRLVPAEIYLEDPEHGGETSCQLMVDGFFGKITVAKQAVLQELRVLDDEVDSGLVPLNGAVNSNLPSDEEVLPLHQEEMERFGVSKIKSVLQEIKEVQNTFENEIQQCDNLEPSVTGPSLNQYKEELQATSEVIKEREKTLKALGEFMSSLKAAKASIEAESVVQVMDRGTLQEKQSSLEALEKDIYLLGQEAEKLDDRLQSAEIVLENPEYGGVTSCQKMITVFFDKLESARQAVLSKLQMLQEGEVLESRQKALCKHIEDIQGQVDKTGLQDPTIHAVQQRMKSLIKLEEKLESFTKEKTSLSEEFWEFLQTSQIKDASGWEECEMLWEETVQYIAQSKEQCQAVIDLLRKFQSYKTELTSLIQKAEMLLSQQSSYTGKENLQKIQKKVEEVKQDFDGHAEDIEEISSICNKLHSQINRIKSFEESPFQAEANTIIDKWLDVNEKLESYNENLNRIDFLWGKILQLSGEAEQWCECRKNISENSDLTREEVLLLKAEADNQEKHLDGINTLMKQIQNILQCAELPLELQIIQTTLQSKIDPISKFAADRDTILESSLATSVSNPPADVTDGELMQTSTHPSGEVSKSIDGEPITPPEVDKSVDAGNEMHVDGTQQSPTASTSQPQRTEFQMESEPEMPRAEERAELGALRARLSELQKTRETLTTDLQPGLREKLDQLAGFTQLLQEAQEINGSLAEFSSETTADAPQSQESQQLEVRQLCESFLLEIQDAAQTLGSRVERHRQYDSLFAALNHKMTSFYEEVLNFTGSSRENAACEQKRQKLQILRDQYEVLQIDMAQVSEIAEEVKQSTSSPGNTRIQEALDMYQCKMRGCLERLDYLKIAIELPPIEKPKKKKSKKGTKKKSEHGVPSALELSVQFSEEPVILPATETLVMSPVQSRGEAEFEPSVEPAPIPSVQSSAWPTEEHAVEPSMKKVEAPFQPPENCFVTPALEPSVHPEAKTTVQLPEQSTDQPNVELSIKPEAGQIGALTVILAAKPTDYSSVTQVEETSGQPTVEISGNMKPEHVVAGPKGSSTQITIGSSVQPVVQTFAHPVAKPSLFPDSGSIQPAQEPSVQPKVEIEEQLSKKSTVQPSVDLSLKPEANQIGTVALNIAAKPTDETSVKLVQETSVQPTADLSGTMEAEHSVGGPKGSSTLVTVVTTLVQPLVQPVAKPLLFLDSESSLQPAQEPSVQPTVEIAKQLPAKSIVQPSVALSMKPEANQIDTLSVDVTAKPRDDYSVKLVQETSVQPTAELSGIIEAEHSVGSPKGSSIAITVESSVQSVVQSLVHPVAKPSLYPDSERSLQPAQEPSKHPKVEIPVELSEKSTVQQPAVELSGTMEAEPLVGGPSSSTVPITEESSVQSVVQPLVQPEAKPSLYPDSESLLQHAQDPSVHAKVSPNLPAEPFVLHVKEQSVQYEAHSSVQPIAEPPVPHAARPSLHPTVEPTLHPSREPSSLLVEEPSLLFAAEPSVKPAAAPSLHPVALSSLHSTAEPAVQTAKEPSVEAIQTPTEQVRIQPNKESSVHSVAGLSGSLEVKVAEKPAVEPKIHSTVQLVGQPSVQYTGDISVQSTTDRSSQRTTDLAELSLGVPTTTTSEEMSESSADKPPSQPVQDKMQTGETSDCDAAKPSENVLPSTLEHLVQDVTECIAQDVVLGEVKDAVELAVQDKEHQVLPAQHVSEPPKVSLEESTDQLSLSTSTKEKTKERKASKGKKKKKGTVPSSSQVKKALNGAISPVQKTDPLNHNVEDFSVESVQRKMTVDAPSGSLIGVTEVKSLEEPADVKEEEAIGQLRKLRGDCEAFRRQLQTWQAGDDALRISSLITAVEETLLRADRLPNDGGNVVILNEVQPLYDEIKSYIEGLSRVSPDTAVKVSEEKTLKDDYENGMGKTAQDIQFGSGQSMAPTSEDVPAIQAVSSTEEPETTLEGPPPFYAQFQQEMQQILSNVSLMGGDSAQAENTLAKCVSRIQHICAEEDGELASELSPEESHMAVLEMKISSFRKQPPKLNVMELEQEIQDLEKLHIDISQLRFQESTSEGKARNEVRQSLELLLSKREDLLNEVASLRTEKKIIFQTLKRFQDALRTAKQSYQKLCKDKESLKIAPSESHASHLDKVKNLLNEVGKEKARLHALKAEQANIRRLGISNKDTDKMDVEVNYIEELWEQVEFSICREHIRLTKEAEELADLKEKINNVRSIIQVQQDLLDQPSPSPEDILKASLGLSADMQAINHCFYLLKNTCDLQMKRAWGPNERQDLENSLDSLQSELENLEDRVKDRQLTRCQTPDSSLEEYPFLKPLYDSLLWVRKSQGKASSEHAIPLLLKDLERQIMSCKEVDKDILKRKSAVDSTIGESKHISCASDLSVSEDFSSFFRQLQELYQERITQSVSRLQQLELGQEKRKALFSEIEKLKELLQCLEKEATPVKRGIFTTAELREQLNCLKAKTTEMEEIEGLVLTLLRNSQSYHGELKNSEQLYLNDVLRSLKSKARRIRRLEEKTFSYTKKLLTICNEFQERVTSLQQNLNVLQTVEPRTLDEPLEEDGEGFEKKLQVSQNAFSSSQDHLAQILRHKDLFEDNKLCWDDLTIANLQKNCLRLAKKAKKSGHLEHFGLEQRSYRELSEKIKMMVCSLQKESDRIVMHFDVISVQQLCNKVKKISILTTEALDWLHGKQHVNEDAIRVEEQTLRALAEDMDRFHHALNQLVTDYYAKEKSFPNRMKQAFYNLKRINTELHKPFVNELDENEAQERLLILESLREVCRREVQGVESMLPHPPADDLKNQLQVIENIGKDTEKRITDCINTTTETYNMLQALQVATAKVAELSTQHEETLQIEPFDLGSPEEQMDLLNSKQEDLNDAIAEIRRIICSLQSSCSEDDRKCLDDLLNQVTNRNQVLSEMWKQKQATLASYWEKYQHFTNNKQKVLEELEGMETSISESLLQKPTSYKAALEQWEKSKNLVGNLQAYEVELQNLQQAASALSTGKEEDVLVVDKMVTSLWDRWLYLLAISRDWEVNCNELKQDWKFISQLMEREVILLDNCQEEVLDKPDMKHRTSHLRNVLEESSRFKENAELQHRQLSLLKHNIQNVLGMSEAGPESVPVVKEIQSMEAKCKKLLQKAVGNKKDIEAELEEREAVTHGLFVVRESLREVSSILENVDMTDAAEAKALLEEQLALIVSAKEKAGNIMERLQERYGEAVPGDLLSQAEKCQEYLLETEGKVLNEIEQCSPYNIMTKKVNEIKAGLHAIEAQLTVKSKDIFQAKELQKKIWDEVDSWHSKLHALESEVQDMAEEDPIQAQDWMDKLTEPFNYHQQVTYLVERRTTELNKAATKLEEYEESLKSTKLWIENTNSLLNEEMKNCTAKVLNKHVTALAIALDDSEQKELLLDKIYSEVDLLAVIFETDSIVESHGEVRNQVKDLQQRLLQVLPQIQHLTSEVGSIESEVKRMEKRVDSIKTILTSSEIDEMSPREHYKNGQVILENIDSIRGTIAEIQAYGPSLAVFASGVQSLGVFRRMGRLLREAEMLERVTKEQSELLEPIVSEMAELEQEQEKLKYLSKNVAYENPEVRERAEELRNHLEELNQKKEAVLLSQRSSVTQQLMHLQMEPQEPDLDTLWSPVTEGVGGIGNEANKMDPFSLPSLVEEVEESTLPAEVEGKLIREEADLSLPGEEEEQLEDVDRTLAGGKPEMILNDCQGTVTEVELWLEKVNLSLADSKQEPDMLQSLEQQLLEFQKTLQETEKKINSLLEDADYKKQGHRSVLDEAEALSFKLKDLKVSLETVQAGLQAKPTTEQDNITDKKYPTEKLLTNQEIFTPSQNRNAAAGEVVVGQSRPRGKACMSEDITWSKWQYLQKELSHRSKAGAAKPTKESEVERDVRLTFISRLPGRTIKSPPTEDSKHLLSRLQSLSEDAAASSQESGRSLRSALFVWLCSVSQWLQKVEEMLETEVSREEASAELGRYQTLSADLNLLSEEMRNKMESLIKLLSQEGENVGVLSQCYNDIRNWLLQTHSAALSKTRNIQEELQRHNHYQNDIRLLYDKLLKKKLELAQQLGNRSGCDVAELLQESAAHETELQKYESDVSVLRDRGEKLSIPSCSNQEIHKLEDVLDDTWKILRMKQDQFSGAAIAQSQIEALLHGVTDLVCVGKEKMKKSKHYKCRSRDALQSKIQDHQNFFSILDSQALLLQAFSSKTSTPANCRQNAEIAVQEAGVLSKESEDHCVHMMGVIKEWDEFTVRYDRLCKKFEELKSQMPTKSLVEESEERVNERLNQYQHIKGLVDDSECLLGQVTLAGKRLQSHVDCAELDSQLHTLEQQWSPLTKTANHELHRLQSLASHLASYNRDSAEFSSWLKAAHQELTKCRMQSLDASQDLHTIKHNLQKFVEFTYDVDEKSSLKASVVNGGNQLLRLKEADPAMLKVNLATLEEKWSELIGALPPVQEKLQQLLVEKLPSLQAIQELMDWMGNCEHSADLQALEGVQNTAADLRGLLHKYKMLRKEMSHKQWVVDFVNQSLPQFSVGNVESKRYERMEFAERLGTLNLQWNTIQGDLNRKIQHTEHALQNISDQESRRQSVSNWFDAQQERWKKLQKPSSLIAAESVLAECSEFDEQIKAKSHVIEELEKSKGAAGDLKVSKAGEPTAETLLRKRDVAANQVTELKALIQSLLRHWKTYNENNERVKKMLTKVSYILDQTRNPTTSLNCLKHQLKRLQSAQEEIEQHAENWATMTASLGNMEGLCSPSALVILEQDSKEAQQRWSAASEELSGHLQSAASLLQLWEAYSTSCQDHTQHMEQLEGKCQQFLHAKLSEDREADTLRRRIQDLQVLEQSLQGLRALNLQVSELADRVIRQNPLAADMIHSERQNTSYRIDHLEISVSSKVAELLLTQNEVETFKKDLEKLESYVKTSSDFVGHVCLSQKEKEDRSEGVKKHLLELRELSADIEHLNEEIFTLPLDDGTLMKLQNLKRSWESTENMALDDCREHRAYELERNSFIQNYETWMQCVEKMENNLTVAIAGTFEALKKQQEIYERFQAEIAINEHILPSFVNKTLSVFESEEEEHRNEVILKLTSLKQKWQSVIRLVQQRNRDINTLLKQWWQFRTAKQRLEKYLSGVQAALSSVHPQKCHSLANAEKLLQDFKEMERHLKRRQPVYTTTVENCKDLIAVAEPQSKDVLQHNLTELQDLWQNTTQQLQDMLNHLTDTAEKRQSFEHKVEDKRKSLQDLKTRVGDPLPTQHEALQRSKSALKELEEALDDWGDSLRDLDSMKSELSQYMVTEDSAVLKQQVEALHRQWEELCLRVSMRKQEIEDRLNAWNVFSEKNKELCDWLTQMESKVLQTADVNIEEMIEKLQKDCMEEINLFSENKLHLKEIGDQLITASNKTRSKEIENKLNKVNERWKHLFDVIGSRVKRLKETLVVIQQLDKNMSNLRTWLARIESELSKPVIYSICDDQEINRKLEEQKDLQKDIELHRAGVASVLSICERLLHDTDACASETECDSIQQTTRSLDKRWQNICSMSMERRLRIEETWRLWQKFLEDYSKFDDWLKEAEAMAASPDSSDVLYTRAKEEQKKFEAFQRQIHERLTHLELINKQYRRLARENRTDAASRLKQMVHEGNQRWDQLQRRVAAILRRLKHFTSQREDFEASRDSILVWLTEMDLQLTNVEHFSESDIEDKMKQLKEFKQEITLHTNKIDQLIVFGEQLIQKSEAMDAVVIEDELEEIHRYCQEVFGRVYRFHERLTSKDLSFDEEREASENDTDGEDSREMQNSSWHSALPEVEASHQSFLMPPPPPHERSGRETPVSVDSIPLEWDPTVDVGGSSMHENEEEGAYYNPLADVEIPENPEAYVIMTSKTVQASSGQSNLETSSWHSPDKRMAAIKPEYNHSELVMGLMSAGSKDSLERTSQGQMFISSPSREKDERTSSAANEQPEDKGLQGLYSPETHSGVIERWEIIHAQSLSNELTAKQNLQQWQQLNSDLDNITLWLENTEAELNSAEKSKPSVSIQQLEHKVKRLKDTLNAFDNYKALVLSANLSSKEFQQMDDRESRNLLGRLHEVNSRWDAACHRRDKWRESLQHDLSQCEEFQDMSHQLLLWLTEAESNRLKCQASDHRGDPQALLECQRQLMHLEEQLLEKQVQANSLQEMSSSLLGSTAAGGYTESDERTHVIVTKIRRLLKQIEDDQKSLQQALDDCSSDEVDLIRPVAADSQAKAAAAKDPTRKQKPNTVQEASKKPSFFYRVLRAAIPLQLLLLLLLLLACMIPFSEEDYSCAQANNFARSFYPMLRYTNGPPPT